MVNVFREARWLHQIANSIILGEVRPVEIKRVGSWQQENRRKTRWVRVQGPEREWRQETSMQMNNDPPSLGIPAC